MPDYNVRDYTFLERWVPVYGLFHYNRRISKSGIPVIGEDHHKLHIRHIHYIGIIGAGTIAALIVLPEISKTLEKIIDKIF